MKATPFVIVVLVLGMVPFGVAYYDPPWQVFVANELANPPTTLHAHCQSKDDNLGMQKIAPGGDIRWEFRSSIISTTKFWCVLRKNNLHARVVVFADDDTEIVSTCSENLRQCHWVAKDAGICLLNKGTNGEGPCHKWRVKMPKN